MAQFKFEDIAYNITTKRKPLPEDKYKYIGLEHMESGSLFISQWGLNVDIKGEKLIMQKGDILLGKRNAYLRRAAIAPHDGLFSAHGMILRPNLEIVDKDYFPFFIASDYFFDEAIRISVGGLSPTINWKDLAKVIFNLPPLNKQKDLAKKLWAAYRLKEGYKKLLKATDEMVKSQFIEMFGDPLRNSKCWPIYSKIENYADIILGTTPSTKKTEFWDGDCLWITPAEMTDESFYIQDTNRHITELGVKSAKLTKMPVGTVLFSTRAPIGKTGIAQKEMFCNQGFKNFVCKEGLNNIFLYYTLKYNKESLQKLGTGTTFKELSKKTISSLKIAIPPIELQNKFDKMFHQADKSKFELRKSIDAIDKVIKSIIN